MFICVAWVYRCVCVFIIHNILNAACVSCQKSTATAAALHALLQNCKWSSHIHIMLLLLLLLLLFPIWIVTHWNTLKPAPKCTHNDNVIATTTTTTIAATTMTTVALDSTVQLHFGTILLLIYTFVFIFAWKMTRFCLFMRIFVLSFFRSFLVSDMP